MGEGYFAASYVHAATNIGYNSMGYIRPFYIPICVNCQAMLELSSLSTKEVAWKLEWHRTIKCSIVYIPG